ncbi:MAG: 5'/3'-nucleotidase SurE [Bacteroidales bacterium]|nr:5'/3'-nucleotidase SurE [Bacteroidales bacterium]
MNILVTNDDGYKASGLRSLVKVLRPLGDITVVAPKFHQSGMSMAITMGFKPIAVKKLSEEPSERWYYLDGTPASCVKFGIDNVIGPGARADLVVSGINHGANAATACLYSGTVGSAIEGAVNGIPAIAVSLDTLDPDADFSAVEQLLPGIIDNILSMSDRSRKGLVFNINFPNIPLSEIKGVRLARMGMAHWEREYQKYDPDSLRAVGVSPTREDLAKVAGAEPGEEFYVMAGDFTDEESNTPDSDHRLMFGGYVAVTVHDFDNTARAEIERLRALGFEKDFR